MESSAFSSFKVRTAEADARPFALLVVGMFLFPGGWLGRRRFARFHAKEPACLLYTSDAADEL